LCLLKALQEADDLLGVAGRPEDLLRVVPLDVIAEGLGRMVR
jgi:hypothetical protein